MSFLKSLDYIVEKVREDIKGKFGIICLNCIVILCKDAEILDFLERNEIKIPESITLTKLDYVKLILNHFYNKYENNSSIKQNFTTALEYISSIILSDDVLGKYLFRLDFISKQDLIDIFADYCADLDISVFDVSEVSGYSVDLYLTKKKPFLRTETVIVRNGYEMTEEKYSEVLQLLKNASEIAIWSVFVTTPIGMYHIGLERLKKDMERLNTWLYVIDPLRRRVFGITKGKKTPEYDSTKRDEFIQKLPHEPLRAPSKLKKLSEYIFKENESYNPNNFDVFEVLTPEEHNRIVINLPQEPRYREIFKNLMIMDKYSGIPLITYPTVGGDGAIFYSGFLTAIDGFISEIGGTRSLEEIKYKGFFVNGSYGNMIKVALFLLKPADQGLKERLAFFVNKFEKEFEEEIEEFKKNGAVDSSHNELIEKMIKEILEV